MCELQEDCYLQGCGELQRTEEKQQKSLFVVHTIASLPFCHGFSIWERSA